MDKVEIKRIKNILKDKATSIVIVSHVNPDGDAVGSSLGLFHYLRNAGYKKVNVISPNAFPEFLSWMPGSEKIILANQQSKIASELLKNAAVLFCLDFNDMERTDDLSARLKKSTATKILIDHHPDPQPGFHIVLSQVTASSTAELMYEFFEALQGVEYIDKTVAECLYAGIITDTGSFSFACNNPRTYHITAILIALGVDGEKIHRLIYDTYSEDRMRLLGYCLSEKLKVLKEHKTSYIWLSANDLQRFNFKEGDTEGVVNYGLSIKGIALTAIFIERKDNIKISLRSEGQVNVNVLARKYFNGGGHKNAAGGNHKDTLENTLTYFENLLEQISTDNFKALDEIAEND